MNSIHPFDEDCAPTSEPCCDGDEQETSQWGVAEALDEISSTAWLLIVAALGLGYVIGKRK